MSDHQFGERYFATRERLTDVMRGIAELAGSVGTDLGNCRPLEETNTHLGAPFLFVVCGEVNSGKSTLINALFGRELCKTNVLPETQRVLWYRYGSPTHDVAITPLLHECHRPLDFLRNFNLVDTPGTNSVVQGHQEIIEQFLPSADLILVVFPVSNPWGAATWNAVSRIPHDVLDRVVFVIQQIDQREPADIDIITGHIADLSHKRLGRVPPIFAVSGKTACEAKHTTPPTRKLLQASGLPPLEDWISNTVCLSPERRNALHAGLAQATSALHAVEDRIEENTRTINAHNQFITDLEREIDAIRERFVSRLSTHLAGVAEVFQSEGVLVSKTLGRKLNPLSSLLRLFVGDRTGPEIETVFGERLQAAVEAVAEKDSIEVAEACEKHWEDLVSRVQTHMGIDPEPAEPINETLASAKQRFVERLGNAARQGIGNLKVRNQLDKDLRRRNLALKSFMATSLVLISAGAICGSLGLPWIPAILCSLGGLFLLGALLTSWLTARSITRDFLHRLLDTCGAFANTLHEDYEEALRLAFRDYTGTLGVIRTHLARTKLAFEPRLKRWQELFLTLKAIEQDF